MEGGTVSKSHSLRGGSAERRRDWHLSPWMSAKLQHPQACPGAATRLRCGDNILGGDVWKPQYLACCHFKWLPGLLPHRKGKRGRKCLPNISENYWIQNLVQGFLSVWGLLEELTVLGCKTMSGVWIKRGGPPSFRCPQKNIERNPSISYGSIC